MLDIKHLRYNLNTISKKLSNRNFFLDHEKFKKYDIIRKSLQKKTEILQSKRNFISKKIGLMKSQGIDIIDYCKNVKKIGNRINHLKKKLEITNKKIKEYMLNIPNLPASNVPIGLNCNSNLEIYKWGSPRNFNFLVKDHVKIGITSKNLDFIAATKIAKSRFVVMYQNLAKLHRILIQFMLDIHVKYHGYLECYVPYVANDNSLIGTGQLPKFKEDLFHLNLKKKDRYYLIPTGEVSLLNIKKNEILEEDTLPIKMVTCTPCFRSENLSYGKDVKGLIRMHQFEKIEMVQIVIPEKSMQALEEMTNHAERILKLLKLPYRKILLCTGDMSFASCKTYDLEVWLPSQNTYREVSSCSNTSDFQSRRMKIRYRNKKNKKISLVHTLNGSGLAVSRVLAAIIENNQLSNGSIMIPKVLQKYMNGMKYI